ncbi:MAG: hypothetical protein IJA85_02035 [Clostridia bacterium]|nr:hypothetical protein [Clostridia bacterium]
MDFTQPWWDQRSVEDLSINNKLFLVASDITILDDDATSGIIFNKAMAQDYNSPDFYELVKTGKWTLDALVDATKEVAGDLNGDSVINEEDRYGIIGQLDFAHSCFIGAGSKFAGKNTDDLPYDSFYNERNVAVCEKILDIMYNTDNFYNAHRLPVKGNEVFANNQGLFKWIRLEDITKLRRYDVEFGILPTPKYDEQQDTYYSAVSSHNGTLLTVPVIHNNPEMVGCILEALAAESKYVLIPAYYDLTLISKGIRDEQSEEMLDIIVSQRSFDFGDIFGFGGFAETWLYMTYYDQKDIASLYEKTSKKIGNDIEKLIEKVLELD